MIGIHHGKKRVKNKQSKFYPIEQVITDPQMLKYSGNGHRLKRQFKYISSLLKTGPIGLYKYSVLILHCKILSIYGVSANKPWIIDDEESLFILAIMSTDCGDQTQL